MKYISALLLSLLAHTAFAQTYNIEPSHTYPSFEADHMGISVWRGKFTKSSGTITLDRTNRTGTVNVTIDTTSVNFGHEKMDEHAKAKDLLDTAQFPTATFKGNNIKFNGDQPVSVDGIFTLRGVSKPLTLTINKFKCIQHPFFKREVCGADASATFNRGDFGITLGLPMFSPEVKLAIQVEALRAD